MVSPNQSRITYPESLFVYVDNYKVPATPSMCHQHCASLEDVNEKTRTLLSWSSSFLERRGLLAELFGQPGNQSGQPAFDRFAIVLATRNDDEFDRHV